MPIGCQGHCNRVTSSEATSSRLDMSGIYMLSETGNGWSKEATSSWLGVTGILVLRFSVHSVEEIFRLDMAGKFGLATTPQNSMKNRCEISMQWRHPFSKPVSTRATQWRNSWSSWKTWNAQNGRAARLEIPRLLHNPNLEYLQYLGDSENSKYSHYHQSEQSHLAHFVGRCLPMRQT